MWSVAQTPISPKLSRRIWSLVSATSGESSGGPVRFRLACAMTSAASACLATAIDIQDAILLMHIARPCRSCRGGPLAGLFGGPLSFQVPPRSSYRTWPLHLHVGQNMDTTGIPKPHFSVSTKCRFHLGFSLGVFRN